MRPLLLALCMLIAFGIAAGCGARAEVEPGPAAIEGVWSYVDDTALRDIEGMSFFTDRHFAFVVTHAGPDSLGDGRAVLAYAGTYTLTDSLVEATIHHAHDPSLVGQPLRWIHGSDGETATYRILAEDGSIVASGTVRRLE